MSKMLCILIALCGAIVPAIGAAEEFPARPIKVVVGFAPGGRTDTVNRILAAQVEKQLGVKIVIENKAGANGSIAARAVAQSAADGYTLLSINHVFVIYPALSDAAPYTMETFDPIGRMTVAHDVILVNASSPWKSFDQLIQYAHKNPKQLKVGTAGVGSLGNLSIETINRKAKMEYIHVPFSSEANNVTALLGGHLDLSFCSLSIALPHLKSDRVRALATPAQKRIAVIPEVPTLNELGYSGSGFAFEGIGAPKNVPPDRLARIRKAYENAIMDPETNESLVKAGVVRDYLAPQAFQSFLANTYEDVKRLAQEAKIRYE